MEVLVSLSDENVRVCGWILTSYKNSVYKFCRETAGGAKLAARRRTLKFTINDTVARPETTPSRTWMLCATCHANVHREHVRHY